MAIAPNTISFITLLILLNTVSFLAAVLDTGYYDRTCPQVESIILDTIRNAIVHDLKVPARLLRMFFHDCFIRGCDASVLLDSTPGNRAEKDGPPNISLRSFYVIDDAKTKLESACPGIVSCADILSISARDVVALSGGPKWEVLKGRKDGKVSIASETINLPSPSFTTTQLIQSFGKRGLGVKDLVALSGGHTLGFSHCSSFESRIRNFSSSKDIDPNMNKEFSVRLRSKCPKPNKDHAAGEFLDFTASTFDNDYYKRLMGGEGVFGSDQALYTDYRTRWMVEAFGRDEGLFFKEFAASMAKLGMVGVKIDDGEVRVNCRVVN